MIKRSLSCVALLLGMSGLLLTGCGGGGSSSGSAATMISTPVVTDSSSSVAAAASRAYSPNYAPVITNDGTWSSHNLAVYVPSENDYAIADAAMRRWEQATDNYFQFTRVATAAEAQITLQRVSADTFESGILGKTKYTFNTGTAQLTSADVRIANTGTETAQTVVAIHELGHALGIHGHSDGNTDAMYYAVTPQTAITERDLNTIFWLYSNPTTSTSRAAGTIETRELECKH